MDVRHSPGAFREDWLDANFIWPMWVIGAGALVFLIGLITGNPGMAIPASIVAGIGGILYYQETTGNFSSWSYMWTLIPGFVGNGVRSWLGCWANTPVGISQAESLRIWSSVRSCSWRSADFFGGLSILGDYGAPILIILLVSMFWCAASCEGRRFKMRRDNIFWRRARFCSACCSCCKRRALSTMSFVSSWPLILMMVGGWMIVVRLLEASSLRRRNLYHPVARGEERQLQICSWCRADRDRGRRAIWNGIGGCVCGWDEPAKPIETAE